MSSNMIKPVQIMTDYFIDKISGGTVSFYAAGSKLPNNVDHPLVRGTVKVLTFDIADPAATYDVTTGKLDIHLAEQTYSYDNYSYPNFFRIHTSTGLAVYQGNAFAHGRDVSPYYGHVQLVNKMLHDIYDTPDGNRQFERYFLLLPPNYKCVLPKITIELS